MNGNRKIIKIKLDNILYSTIFGIRRHDE